MRCPKCHYLSFEPESRCRNCGYGFSLDEADLLLKDPETAPVGAMVDLDLRATPTRLSAEEPRTMPAVLEQVAERVEPAAPRPPRAPRRRAPAVDRARVEAGPLAAEAAPAVAPHPPVAARVQPAPTAELPLFVKGIAAPTPEEAVEDQAPAMAEPAAEVAARRPVFMAEEAPEPEPIVRRASEPRPPLAVRRTAAEPVAAESRQYRPVRKLGPLDRDLLADLQRIERMELQHAAAERTAAELDERVGAGTRAAAAALDAVLMGSLATCVLAVTLRWSELPFERALALPIVPTAAFLLLVVLGYILMFTAAGGQTLGKMAFGIRVVGDDTPDHRLSMRQAAYRSVLALPSVLALGAGFLPALVGDERALHDRLAHTRVVRA